MPVKSEFAATTDEMIVKGDAILKRRGLAASGDRVVDAGRPEPHRGGHEHAAGAHGIVKSRPAAALLLIILVGTTACGPKHFRFPPAVDPPLGFVQEGVASWYGPGYHGKKTSNGEVFDQDELTAAHMTFVFGTRVRVTMLSNGKSVVVRINDRFPNKKGSSTSPAARPARSA